VRCAHQHLFAATDPQAMQPIAEVVASVVARERGMRAAHGDGVWSMALREWMPVTQAGEAGGIAASGNELAAVFPDRAGTGDQVPAESAIAIPWNGRTRCRGTGDHDGLAPVMPWNGRSRWSGPGDAVERAITMVWPR
jgi:hypothetical protein